jgi:hypothetical protein
MSLTLKQYHNVVGSLSGQFLQTGLEPTQYFPWAILRMNQMYGLPINTYPTLDHLRDGKGEREKPVARISKFLGVLADEIAEGQEIKFAMQLLDNRKSFDSDVGSTDDLIPTVEDLKRWIADFGLSDEDNRATKLAVAINHWMSNPEYGDTPDERLERFVLVSLADWLGDMIVYIRSEGLKYGLPIESALSCIMGSNFTKLDENKQPIVDVATGKVQKGPNFEPPERYIHATMFGFDPLLEQAQDLADTAAQVEALTVDTLADPMAAVIEAEQDAQEPENIGLDDEDEADDESFALPA